MLCIGETLGWSPWLSWLLTFIIGGGLITFVVWLIISLSQQHRPTAQNSALDVAKKRYAKGEITKEEYDQYKKDLS